MTAAIVTLHQALAYTKLRDTQVHHRLTQLKGVIARPFALKGTDVAPEDLSFIASELSIILEEKYGFLSMEEVKIALDNGVKKAYGEYYGLSVITFLDWIAAYVTSQERRRAMEEIERNRQPQEDPETTGRKNLLAAIRMRQQKIAYPSLEGSHQYLVKKGIIKDQDHLEVTQEAEASVDAREKKISTENRFSRSIMAGWCSLSREDRVTAVAKTILVERWIDKQTDIDQIIKRLEK